MNYNQDVTKKSHQLHIYYGTGKGKTTACLGLAIRCLGAGKQVTILYFDKGHDAENEHYSERKILRQLDHCTIIPTGCERLNINKDGSFRFGVLPEDLQEAQKALNIIQKLILNPKQDILILDEILAAVAYKLISKQDVMDIVDLYNKNRSFELVFSGHIIWPELQDKADLVTQVKKVKHYFDKGIPPRLGIEI